MTTAGTRHAGRPAEDTMVEITHLEHAETLDDRTILDCIHAFAVEERRLRTAAPDDVDEQRLAEIQLNLDELWGLLRSRRTERSPLVQA